MFLVAIDAHLKWPKVHIMKETTAAKMIDVLQLMFFIVWVAGTDNGHQFVSEDFAMFTKMNSIKHICCSYAIPPLLQTG